MRRIVLATLIPLALSLTGAPACGQNETPAETARQQAGRIRVNSLEHDFGEHMALDPTVVHYVPVHNDGDGPLTVTAVRTSCGCVVGTMRDGVPTSIPPGESRDLELRLNPAGWGQDKSKPTVITVESDDPQTPQTRIRMQATIKRAIVLDPFPVTFGEVGKQTPEEIILTVTGRTSDFEAYAATIAGSEAFEVEVLDTAPTQRDGETVGQTKIRIALLPTAPVGLHQGLITVRTTDRARRLTSVGVTATVTGDLEFDTNRLAAGAMRQGESTTQTFRLTHKEGEPFKILKVEEFDDQDRVLPEPVAKITPLPEEEGAGYEVTVTIRADRPQPPTALSGYIVLTTNLPLEEKVRVRYAGRVLAADAPDPAGSDGQ